MNTPRLPIDSCEALFEKLKWDCIQLEKDWSSSYCIFNFVVTGYHLYKDWIMKAGTAEQKKRCADLPENGKLLFNVWRDVANATKHWQLYEKNHRTCVVNDVSGPIIGDWYSYFVVGPVLYVQVGDALPSVCELVPVTMGCFEWLLRGDDGIELADLVGQLDLVFRPIKPNENESNAYPRLT